MVHFFSFQSRRDASYENDGFGVFHFLGNAFGRDLAVNAQVEFQHGLIFFLDVFYFDVVCFPGYRIQCMFLFLHATPVPAVNDFFPVDIYAEAVVAFKGQVICGGFLGTECAFILGREMLHPDAGGKHGISSVVHVNRGGKFLGGGHFPFHFHLVPIRSFHAGFAIVSEFVKVGFQHLVFQQSAAFFVNDVPGFLPDAVQYGVGIGGSSCIIPPLHDLVGRIGPHDRDASVFLGQGQHSVVVQ